MAHDSKLFDRQWLPAKNVGSTAIPAYGAVVVAGKTTSGGLTVWQVRCTEAGDFLTRQIVLNGPQAIAPDRFGSITTADIPAKGLGGTSGKSFGTVPGSYVLAVGLPGLASIGNDDRYTRDYSQRTFMAEVEGVWAGDHLFGWINVADNGSWTYAHPVGYAALRFTLRLPRNGQDRDPNTQPGNIVPWTLSLASGEPEAVALNCLDEKIGTISIITEGTEPQGWQTYDFGAQLIRGGADGAPGGSKTHTHNLVQVHSSFVPDNPVSSPVSGSATAENVPPYMTAYFIERFE